MKEANNMATAADSIDVSSESIESDSDDDSDSGNENCQELIIHKEQMSLLRERKQKIETSFNVKVVEANLMQEDGSQLTAEPMIQWIRLIGSKDDCQDAAVSKTLNVLFYFEFKVLTDRTSV
jgi:hypothetical protein